MRDANRQVIKDLMSARDEKIKSFPLIDDAASSTRRKGFALAVGMATSV